VNEALQRKSMVNVAEDKIYVTDLKGPLEEGWRAKVAAFVAQILQDVDVARAVAHGPGGLT